MVEAPPFHTRGMGLTVGPGTEILHAKWCSQKIEKTQQNLAIMPGLLHAGCRCSVAKLCLTLCDPMDCSTPGFPVLHHFSEFAQIHVP